jgi:hypothetical protein
MKSAAGKVLILMLSHLLAIGAGFGLGIYMLPILTAPDSPDTSQVQSVADTSQFTGTFRRDLKDSDPFHYGEGDLFVGPDMIAFEGKLAPGPDYRLYLSPEFVETEARFEALKHSMVEVGRIYTFDKFTVEVPDSIDPSDYNTAIVWCESFGQFITSAVYKQ